MSNIVSLVARLLGVSAELENDESGNCVAKSDIDGVKEVVGSDTRPELGGELGPGLGNELRPEDSGPSERGAVNTSEDDVVLGRDWLGYPVEDTMISGRVDTPNDELERASDSVAAVLHEGNE